jgi:hypothetical protein
MRSAAATAALLLVILCGQSAQGDEPSAAPPTNPSPPPAPAEPTGSVTVDSDNPHATVMEVTGKQVVYGPRYAHTVELSRPVCTVPCDVPLNRLSSYFVAGDGVLPSRDFLLPPTPGPIVLHVKAGSASLKALGQVLTFAGAGLAIGAVASGVVAALEGGLQPGFSASASPFPFVPLCIGLAIGSAAALGVGIPLTVVTRTIVTADSGDRLASASN